MRFYYKCKIYLFLCQHQTSGMKHQIKWIINSILLIMEQMTSDAKWNEKLERFECTHEHFVLECPLLGQMKFNK